MAKRKMNAGLVLFYHNLSNFLNNKNNMAQVTVRGYLTQVGPVLEVGENKTKKQEIVVMIPARKDEFGVEYPGAKAQQWQIISLGESTVKNPVGLDMVDKKVEVNVYVEGYLFAPSDTTKEPFFTREFKLASIKILA